MTPYVVVTISTAVKRCHEHSNSCKRKHVVGACLKSEVLFILIMLGSMVARIVDMVLERVLQLDQQGERGRGTGSKRGRGRLGQT